MFLLEVGEGDSLVWVLGLWATVDGVFWDVAHAPDGGFGEEGVGF